MNDTIKGVFSRTESAFGQDFVSNLNKHPEVVAKTDNTSKLVSLLDKFLSYQKNDGTISADNRETEQILSHVVDCINSISFSSKTYNLFFPRVEKYICNTIQLNNDKYISNNTYENSNWAEIDPKVRSISAFINKTIDIVDLIAINKNESIKILQIIFSQPLLILTNIGVIFFTNAEKIIPFNIYDDSKMVFISPKIIIISQKNNLFQFVDISKPDEIISESLDSIIKSKGNIYSIGTDSTHLLIFQGDSIVQIECDSDNIWNESKSIKSDSPSNSYFYNDKLIKPDLDNIIGIDGVNAFYQTKNGIVVAKLNSSDTPNEINPHLTTLFQTIFAATSKVIDAIVQGKKISSDLLSANFPNTAKALLSLLSRLKHIGNDSQIVIKFSLELIAYNLRKLGFEDTKDLNSKFIFPILTMIKENITKECDETMIKFGLLLSGPILGEPLLINILQTSFARLYIEKSKICEEYLKKPQSLLVITEDVLNHSNDPINLLMRTSDYFSLCANVLKAPQQCAKYVSLVFSYIQRSERGTAAFSALTTLQRLSFHLFGCLSSVDISLAYINGVIPILKNLVQNYGENKDFIVSNEIYSEFKDPDFAFKEYYKHYTIESIGKPMTIHINTNGMYPVTITFDDINYNIEYAVEIFGESLHVYPGLSHTVMWSEFDMKIKFGRLQETPSAFSVSATGVENDSSDILNHNLFLINFMSKLSALAAERCVDGPTPSRREESCKTILTNGFVRSAQEKIRAMSSEKFTINKTKHSPSEFNFDPIDDIEEESDKPTSKLFNFLYQKFNPVMARKCEKYKPILRKIAAGVVRQLDIANEWKVYAASIYGTCSSSENSPLITKNCEQCSQNCEQKQPSIKNCPDKIKIAWRIIGMLQRSLISANQHAIALDQFGTEITDNVELLIDELEKRAEVLRGPYLFSADINTGVKELSSFLGSSIKISDLGALLEIQNQRMRIRTTAVRFIHEFLTSGLLQSSVNTFLVSFDHSLSSAVDHQSLTIGSNKCFDQLAEALSQLLDWFINTEQTNVIALSMMKFFCDVPCVVKQFAGGLIKIVGGSNKDLAKLAEEIFASMCNIPHVIDTLMKHLEDEDPNIRSTDALVLAMSANPKCSSNVLLKERKSEKEMCAFLTLAGRVIPFEIEAKSELSESIPRLLKELGLISMGKLPKPSYGSELISFFRLLLQPFSVHLEYVLECLVNILEKEYKGPTPELEAVFQILGHGVVSEHRTGVGITKSGVRMEIKEMDPKEVSKCFPAARVSLPFVVTLSDKALKNIEMITIDAQKKFNTIISSSDSIFYGTFFLFLATVFQNEENKAFVRSTEAVNALVNIAKQRSNSIYPINVGQACSKLAFFAEELTNEAQTSKSSQDPHLISINGGITRKNNVSCSSNGQFIFPVNQRIRFDQNVRIKVNLKSDSNIDIIIIPEYARSNSIEFVHVESVNKRGERIIYIDQTKCIYNYSSFYIALLVNQTRSSFTYSVEIENRYDSMNFFGVPQKISCGCPPKTKGNDIQEILIGTRVILPSGDTGIVTCVKASSSQVNVAVEGRISDGELSTYRISDIKIIPETISTIINRAERLSGMKDNFHAKRRIGCLSAKIAIQCSRHVVSTLGFADYNYEILRVLLINSVNIFQEQPQLNKPFNPGFITDIRYLLPGCRQVINNASLRAIENVDNIEKFLMPVSNMATVDPLNKVFIIRNQSKICTESEKNIIKDDRSDFVVSIPHKLADLPAGKYNTIFVALVEIVIKYSKSLRMSKITEILSPLMQFPIISYYYESFTMAVIPNLIKNNASISEIMTANMGILKCFDEVFFENERNFSIVGIFCSNLNMLCNRLYDQGMLDQIVNIVKPIVEVRWYVKAYEAAECFKGDTNIASCVAFDFDIRKFGEMPKFSRNDDSNLLDIVASGKEEGKNLNEFQKFRCSMLKFLRKELNGNDIKILGISHIVENIANVAKLREMISNNLRMNAIRIDFDRFKAMRFRETRKGESLLCQLTHQVKGNLSRIAVDHCPLYVTLLGENAIDCGGPGREIFTSICDEINNPEMEVMAESPNARNGITVDELIPRLVDKDLLKTAGAVVAECFPSEMTYHFNIAQPVWEAINGIPISENSVYEIDTNFHSLIRKVKSCAMVGDDVALRNLTFQIEDNYGMKVELFHGGSLICLNSENAQMFIDFAVQMRVGQLKKAVDAFAEGFQCVIQKSICEMASVSVIKFAVCGSNELPAEVLLNAMNIQGNTNHVEKFTEAIKKMTDQERRLVTRFITGRNGIDSSKKNVINVHIDHFLDTQFLPTAATCFLSMSCPPYKNVDTYKKMMLIAAEYSGVITDSDINVGFFR